MTALNSTTARLEKLEQLAKAYAGGDATAGKALVDEVDNGIVAELPPEVRAVLMDAIMAGKKDALDQRSTELLRSALMSTTDETYLSTRGQHYVDCGDFMAAETLLEWRVVLCAKKQQGSPAHIESMIDLAEVYQAARKASEAHDLRTTAANTCERTASNKSACVRAMSRIAQASFDAGDILQAQTVASKALDISETSKLAPEIMIECLRVLHAAAQRDKRQKDAQNFAKRIQRLSGDPSGLDEIERAMTTYVRLPESFELTLSPDGINLTTNDFPCIIQECCGLDLKQYFIDAFVQAEGLTSAEREKLSAGMFHVMNTIQNFVTGPEGARITRSAVTEIELPAAMSQGFVQKMTFDNTVTFRLVPNPPDEATFCNISGITFSVGGKLVRVSEISLRAEGNKCLITPVLDECGQVKQNAANAFQALKNSGKDLLVGMFLKTQKVSTTLPIVQEEYRKYLADAINFKRSLQYKEKDLLSFFERCSRIEIDDPLTRALLEKGMRITKKMDAIELGRTADSLCDLGGLALKFASSVKLQLEKKQLCELSILQLAGVHVKVPFDAPSELSAIGLDLKRSLPTRIESLALGAPDSEGKRRLVTGIAPGRWIALDLNDSMEPAIDKDGNWMIFGVTNNPISGAPQNFFLRLDKNNNLNMTTRELANLVNQTAMEGFDPSDPMTWHWGAVALGSQTLLTAGKILRSTIGDEETDKIAEDVKKVGRFIGKLFS